MSKKPKRTMEMVIDTKWHVLGWTNQFASTGNSENNRKHLAQLKSLAEAAAWNACQNDGFLLMQRKDGILTIIAGPDADEVDGAA